MEKKIQILYILYINALHELRKHENPCLFLEFDHTKSHSTPCLISCLLKVKGKSKCKNKKRWRSEHPRCNKGQLTAAHEAWHEDIPIYNIDTGVKTCGSSLQNKAFLKSMNCRDKKMATEIKKLLGPGKKCRKAVFIAGSAHFFEQGGDRKNIISLLEKENKGLKYKACLIADPHEKESNIELYPSESGEPICSELPEPLGSSFVSDFNSIAINKEILSKISPRGTSTNWNQINCGLYLGCKDARQTECKTPDKPSFSKFIRFYNLETKAFNVENSTNQLKHSGTIH